MLKRYLIILITSILIVIFAVQNVDQVEVSLWLFDVNASLSLLIIITLFIGALVTLLLAYHEIRNRNQKIRDLENKLRESEKQSGAKEFFSGELNDQDT
ncbi:MAG: LapA family protein [Bacteroidales bacterium]|nr:LapA family protein [Bacteroidales bacterium]